MEKAFLMSGEEFKLVLDMLADGGYINRYPDGKYGLTEKGAKHADALKKEAEKMGVSPLELVYVMEVKRRSREMT